MYQPEFAGYIVRGRKVLTTYRTRSSLAFAVAIFCAPIALAQSTSLAAELVEVARFDFAGIHVLRLAAERNFAAGKVSEDEVRCLRTKSDNTYRSILAAYIAQKMTSEELQVAIAFYRSPVGVKYTDHGILLFHKNYGFPLPRPLPNISSSELQEISAFSKTPAGDKLMFQQVARGAMLSPESQALTRSLVKECRG